MGNKGEKKKKEKKKKKKENRSMSLRPRLQSPKCLCIFKASSKRPAEKVSERIDMQSLLTDSRCFGWAYHLCFFWGGDNNFLRGVKTGFGDMARKLFQISS
eukprot:TRINITY_DN8723_c4_g1_i2.p1 TRINITY_DN8723_c4_g1~~TRINITY_DN8723_c4_g1_i2.p1  ORF type:complete len:116 (-),score=7.44 TRINITY_DN8723_c4_g1_i2:370-672(-)